jgi:hypothetical protein
MFGKKKVEEAPEELPKLSRPKKEPDTPIIKVDGLSKSALQPPVQTLVETLLAEYQRNYGSTTDDDQKNLLFAIYAECRLMRDILAQIMQSNDKQ